MHFEFTPVRKRSGHIGGKIREGIKQIANGRRAADIRLVSRIIDRNTARVENYSVGFYQWIAGSTGSNIFQVVTQLGVCRLSDNLVRFARTGCLGAAHLASSVLISLGVSIFVLPAFT